MAETWLRAEREAGANPASLHRLGRRAQGVLEEARDRVAGLLGCASREIVFCATATEANNLAVLGLARGMARMHGTPPLLVSSAAEHPAVLAPLRLLQQEGFELRLVPLDRHGRADAGAASEALAAGPALLAWQWANNETGAVQGIPAVPDGCAFHCDAVQGFGKLAADARFLAADTLVLSGHKMRGPKGVAVLRVVERALLDPIMAGGGQQRSVRPGTEAPALAAAFAHALELALGEQVSFARDTAAAAAAMLAPLRARFAAARAGTDAALQENHPPPPAPRLPNTLSLSFRGFDGRLLLPACDAAGLAVSSGSACSSGAAQPSAVLRACGMDASLARATIRVSFGWGQNAADGEEAGRRLGLALGRIYQDGNL